MEPAAGPGTIPTAGVDGDPAPGRAPRGIARPSPNNVTHLSAGAEGLWLALALVAGGAALLSKEAALSLPLLVLWFDRRGAMADRLRRAAPWFALAMAYMGARAAVLGGIAGYGAGTHLRPGVVALLKPLATFTAALLVPVHPGGWIDGVTATLRGHPAGFAGLAAGAVVLAGLVALRLYGRADDDERHRLVILLGGYLLSLLPYYNLSVSLSGRADRYVYLPSIWLCGLVAMVLARFAPSARMARATLTGVGLGALAAGMIDLGSSYRSAGRLAEEVVARTVALARESRADRLYLVGAPDRLDGVGVLFTGLPAVVRARAGDPQARAGAGDPQAPAGDPQAPAGAGDPQAPAGSARPTVIVAARVEMHGDLEPRVSWTLETGPEGSRVVGSSGTEAALLEGGLGWGDWTPGRPLSRRRVTRLEIPYRADGRWIVIEGASVRLLPQPP
jgi:hypothetical protein